MKRWIVALSVAVFSASMLPLVAEAKRIGGGGSSGMKRDMPARNTPTQTPATPAAPATPGAPAAAAAPAAAGAAAAAGKRSWMGPIAGLAAGLGLAALFSAMGLGGEFANFVMIALLVLVAFFVVRLLLRRFGPAAPMQPATAGATAGPSGMAYSPLPTAAQPAAQPLPASPAGGGLQIGSDLAPAAVAAPAALAPSRLEVPADFDTAGFERIAKLIFLRMQAANDSGDLNDLRSFTTPEMFAAIKLELQERGAAANHTDVVAVDAQVIDFAREEANQIVSVRFHGEIREAPDAQAEAFDEIWHLVKPVDDSRSWAIAGIQQAH
jgi:predicted lipid-binding transport protein (Tim44 family)